MNKSDIRKKLLKVRKEKSFKNFKIDPQIIFKILKKTKTLVFLFCELHCNEKIITSGSGVWKILKKP